MIDYRWPELTLDDSQAVQASLGKNELSYNDVQDSISELESRFRSELDVDYAIAMNSATSALYVAFMCCELKPGDVVLAPTYTFPATVMPLLHLGVSIKFVDNAFCSPSMDVNDLERHIDERVKAIVVAHMDGIAVDMPAVIKVAAKHNLKVIEDCAQAFGAKISGRSVGTFGDLGIFSLQRKKMVPGGEGGMLVSKDPNFYHKAIALSYLQFRAYKELGATEFYDYAYTGLGFNFRIHPFAAALAVSRLKTVSQILSQMSDTLAFVKDALPSDAGLVLVDAPEGTSRSFFSWKFLKKPDLDGSIDLGKICSYLNQHGIAAELALTRSLHKEPIFTEHPIRVLKHLQRETPFALNSSEEFPHAEYFCANTIRLPAYYGLSTPTLERLTDVLRKAVRQGG